MGSCESPVIVKRTEVVAAVLPMQEHWLPMSNLDLLLPPLDVGVFFCYKKKKTTSFTQENMVRILKKALAQTLVTFYAFAGEVVQNPQGEPELLCNNRGVDFTQAYADMELKELDLYNADDSVHGKLVPLKQKGVLSIQVTELRCGGLVIACTFDHRVADAHSANMFLVAWAEIALSNTISLVPSFRRSLLNPRRPCIYDPSYDKTYALLSSLPPPPQDVESKDGHLVSRIYYIPVEEIDGLQAKASSNGTKRSKLVYFSAFLWKIIAEGGHDKSKNCKLGIVVDGRKRLNNIGKQIDKQTEGSLDNYFGNVLSIPYGEASANELKGMPLNKVADFVQKIIGKATNEEHFLGLIDWVELHRPERGIARVYCKESNDEAAVVVSSGQRFPVAKMDFGWGKPEFGSYHFPWGGQTGYVMPMPSMSRNGDWIVYMHLPRKQLDMVEKEAGHVFRPLNHIYLNF